VNVIGLTTSTADRKQRAGQRLVVGLSGQQVTQEERAWIRDVQPGGFILFARNIAEPAQVRELNRELLSLLPRDLPPIRCVDQEGGRVQRVKSPATIWPPMRWVGNYGDLAFTANVARAIAREVRAMHFDLDFAPVADVDSNPKNPIIGDRSFSDIAELAADHVAAFIIAMQAEGCIACAKHFPGHGDTSTDSHLELPKVEKDPGDLEEIELTPFRAAVKAQVGTVMTAHVLFPAWDERLPATMSPRILKTVLRDRMRFPGVVVSDDLEMKAVRDHFPLEQQLALGTAASVDVFLVCSDPALIHASWEGGVHLQETEKSQEDAAIDSMKRWQRLREHFLLRRPPAPDLDILGCLAHQELALRAHAMGQV